MFDGYDVVNLIFGLSEQLFDKTKIAQPHAGRNVGHGKQNETAFRQPRMRHLQPGPVVLQNTIGNEIQIDLSGSKSVTRDPSNAGLDGFQFVEQGKGSKLAKTKCRCIEEVRLILDIHRRSLENGAGFNFQ